MTNTRSKIITATLAAATLAGPFAVTGSQAQAGSHHKFGVGLGIGIATGALLCAAATSYSAPVYVRRHCHYERYVNDWGRVRVVKVCDDYWAISFSIGDRPRSSPAPILKIRARPRPGRSLFLDVTKSVERLIR